MFFRQDKGWASGLKRSLGLWQGMGLLATRCSVPGSSWYRRRLPRWRGGASLWAWLLLIAGAAHRLHLRARLGRRYPHAGGRPTSSGSPLATAPSASSAFLFLAVLPVGLPAALTIARRFLARPVRHGEWDLWAIQLLTPARGLPAGTEGARSSGNLQLLIALAILGLTLLIWFKGNLAGATRACSRCRRQANGPPWALALGGDVLVFHSSGSRPRPHGGGSSSGRKWDYPLALLGGVLLAGLIYWIHSWWCWKYGLYGDEATNATAIPAPALAAVPVPPPSGWWRCSATSPASPASTSHLQGFARLIWSMARGGKLPTSLSRLSGPWRPQCPVLGARHLPRLHHPDPLPRLPLDALIRYANGNFVLVYLLCMAAGWRLLGGLGGWGERPALPRRAGGALLPGALCGTAERRLRRLLLWRRRRRRYTGERFALCHQVWPKENKPAWRVCSLAVVPRSVAGP